MVGRSLAPLALAMLPLFDQGVAGLRCQEEHFLCRNEKVNTILSITDWNREPEQCIHHSLRCDGRHDCQDGSDENDCLFQDQGIDRHFWCYHGGGEGYTAVDCMAADRVDYRPVPPAHHSDSSVSESEEWVCTKLVHGNGSMTRRCERTYTGGENFAVCFWNSDQGAKCICSQQLCNKASPGSLRTQTLVAVWVIVLGFAYIFGSFRGT